MRKTSTTAGIDTSKAKLDIAVHGRTEHWQVENGPAGWQGLARRLLEAEVTRVGIEATGGYERGVVQSLRAMGFTVLVLQPSQVARHLTFVEQIEEDIARLKTRLEHVDDPRHRRIILADIKRLKARRAAELARIAAELRAHDDLGRRFDLVLSIPGIGERTALAIVIRMPELGRISREEAAALAGLAPFDADSGVHKGQRRIAGGRSRLRRSLFAAALPAAFRWNEALVDLYQRLLARGKAHNVALTACARKHLRKRCRPARNAMDQKSRHELMVATIP